MLNYTIEMYIWNQTGKKNSILSSNTPAYWSHFHIPIDKKSSQAISNVINMTSNRIVYTYFDMNVK